MSDGIAVEAAEVFAGSGRLSAAIRSKGIGCKEYDLKKNPKHDFSNQKKMQNILLELENFKYVHFAPPCNSFSQARWPKIRCPG